MKSPISGIKENFPQEIYEDVRLLDQEHKTVVLRGVQREVPTYFEANSADSNAVTFNCTFPKQLHNRLDRQIQLLLPVRLSFAVPSGVPASSYILEPEFCNFRSFPIHKAIQNMSMTINNETFNIQCGKIQSALEHYNTNRKMKLLHYSKTPTYGTSQAQSFNNLSDGTRSGLTPFSNSIAGIAPQNFPFTVVSQTPGGAGGDEATAVIDAVLIEYLQISPLHWGEWFDNYQAFDGVRNMNFTITFHKNCGFRMFAIDNVGANIGSATPTVTSQFTFTSSDNFSYSDLKPKLLVNFLEPQCPLPKDHNLQLRQLDWQVFEKTADSAVAAGTQTTINSDVIRLPKRFRKLGIFCQRQFTDFTTDPYNPDVFWSIDKLEIVCNNDRVLSTAHPAQIYDKCIKNGLQLEFGTWVGRKYNDGTSAADGFGQTAHQFASTGTTILLDIMDLGLNHGLIWKEWKELNLEVKCTVTNISGESQTPTLYVYPITDYLLTMDAKNGQFISKVVTPIVELDESQCTPQSLAEYKDSNFNGPRPPVPDWNIKNPAWKDFVGRKDRLNSSKIY